MPKPEDAAREQIDDASTHRAQAGVAAGAIGAPGRRDEEGHARTASRQSLV
jgi:hypothetical protein